MIAVIQPGRLSGTVRVPASKSASHRALICAALADGPSRIGIDALSQDIEATVRCLRALDADIRIEPGGLRVSPIVEPPKRAKLDCGESGSTLRFMLPLAVALGVRARFTGHGRLPQRPNGLLVDALRAHGASIDSDLLPMNASGPLSPGLWELAGNVSSQYVTGLLLALPLLDGDSEIRLTAPLESASYVEMTLRALAASGITVVPTGTGWRVPGHQRYRAVSGEVEGDWSAAAFWLAANQMGSGIHLVGLREDSVHGDRAVTDLLGRSEIDARHVPDLVPALAVAAAIAPGRTVITGAARLRLKESDRLQAVVELINTLGGRARALPDGLIVEGVRQLRGGTVNGMNDHRIVMAAAIAATVCAGETRITDAGAVEKSYPGFFEDFKRLGGQIHVESAGQ